MYQIILKKKAKKFIDKLPRNEKLRVISAIEQLPDGEDIKKMLFSPKQSRKSLFLNGLPALFIENPTFSLSCG